MANTLLAHLYSHIKGSQEDIATLSLQYLLSNYAPLQREFNVFVGEKLGCSISKETSYICQSVGDENERPDMSGRDADGREVILCEAKFYAGLTDNQPTTYIDRLYKENGTGLLFICPRDRIISLWDKVLSRCEDYTEISSTCADVKGVHMAVASWEEILRMLMRTANAEAKESISDIEQLEGYCALMESEAFVPFRSEDLGPDNARLFERYMYVLDKLADAILADRTLNATTKGLKSTSHRHGYKRYMYIGEYAVDIRFDLQFWSSSRTIDTPYWISFSDRESWKTTDRVREKTYGISDLRKTEEGDSHIYLALEPLTNAVEDDLVDDLKRQIIEYMERLK